MNLVEWFRQAWPYEAEKRALAAEYSLMRATMPLVVADIMLRGGVFGTHGTVRNEYEAGRLEGRREMAVELLRIIEADPRDVFKRIPVKQHDGAKGHEPE